MPPERPKSLQKRIFRELSVIGVLAGVLVTVALTVAFREMVLHDEHARLRYDCLAVATQLDGTDDKVATLAQMNLSDNRATLIAADGSVLYDSEADSATLESHAGRPEFEEALRDGSGSAERRSESVGVVSIYEAIRLDDGSVIRLSEDTAATFALLRDSLEWGLLVLVALVVASWFVSRRMAEGLVRPILQIDPNEPGAQAPYRELEPLVARLKAQQGQLEEQMEQLRNDDAIRREFTANVTHELKTPIASIMGASELMRDGIVRPEDMADFAGRIHGDAQRLSALVSDILTLSKLDESERSRDTVLLGSRQTCDLGLVARDVCDRLAERARRAHVAVYVTAERAEVLGYVGLVDELVGNLVENAIRYNVSGGSVRVETGVDAGSGRPYVVVSDTGVGIAKEDQEKVFERFYRVHKSRSRANGGTGLGLAIVKHAAKVHGATIALESAPGRGTTVRVEFPVQEGRQASGEAGE